MINLLNSITQRLQEEHLNVNKLEVVGNSVVIENTITITDKSYAGKSEYMIEGKRVFSSPRLVDVLDEFVNFQYFSEVHKDYITLSKK
ncbi:hypothetical protein NHYGZSKF_CDS0184 [Staphylococcus phage PG-2021_15]